MASPSAPARRSKAIRPPQLPAIARYAAAIAAALVVLLVQQTALPRPMVAPFVLSYFAVAFAAWLGGRGPGLLATLICGLAANYLLVPPATGSSPTATALLPTLLFMASAGCVALLCGSMRAATFDAQQNAAAAFATDNLLRESEARFTAFMENSPAAAWIVDDEGRYLYASPSYSQTFSVPTKQLVGKAIAEVYPAPLAEEYLAFNRRTIAANRAVESVEPGVRPDGTPGHYLVVKFPLPSGGRVLLAGMAIDITERTEAEKALDDANKHKDEFLAVLSHELRNPLLPIRNSLHLLGRAAPDSEQALRARAVIERQVGQMARLIEDLLDVTRIARGKIRLQRARLDLCEVVRHAVDDHAYSFTTNGVSVELDLPGEPAWLLADSARIAQVVGNLLSNSAKFTSNGDRVRVELRSLDGCARLRVIDTGLGIEPDVLPRLFRAFTQADTTLARSRGGLGLGLALVKGLVELHAGTVEAHSDGVGKGSEFVVCLPLADPAALEAAAVNPSRDDAATL